MAGLTNLTKRDFFGSRYRCLLLTHAPRQTVARLLTQVAEPHATVGSTDFWMPRGFLEPREPRLDRDSGFVANDCQAALRAWWLANPRGANTPNWDIASTCTIEGKRGLLLVEAKAHSKELSAAGKSEARASDASRANHARIGAAIAEANAALNGALPGWSLSRDHHYQISNRFAWAWKIAADCQMPVVLVYLGFLNATDMAPAGHLFKTPADWERTMREHARGVIPGVAWDKPTDASGTMLRAVIRSADLDWVIRS